MADGVSVEIRDVRRTAAKLQRLERTVRTEATRFAHRAQDMLFETAGTLIGLEDHSLRDLADLGHPYARRWAKDTLHPDYLVHIQSNTLRSSLKKSAVVEAGGVIMAWVHNDAYYDLWLQLGTYKMRPRPYMAETASQARPVILSAAAHLLRDAVVVGVGVEYGGGAGP